MNTVMINVEIITDEMYICGYTNSLFVPILNVLSCRC